MPVASPFRTASPARTFPPRPALSPQMVRRRRPLLLPPPTPYGGPAPLPQAGGRAADLRFFVTCYAAGLVFFLVMLS